MDEIKTPTAAELIRTARIAHAKGDYSSAIFYLAAARARIDYHRSLGVDGPGIDAVEHYAQQLAEDWA